MKPVIAEKAKSNILAVQKNDSASAYQKSEKQINTAKELAKAAGVSHDTIAKVEKIEAKAPNPVVEATLKDDLSIYAAVMPVEAP